ncbi:HU family DNA-binding protein [Prevotella ihumii]|uniref:HU family DNA-binding protein n=1 Tax=Prevotella ihumii TaxID=1917878 RepID=UPI0009824757|nr:HU family DNA-binding protein [Prevotella ihumii]
MAKTSLQLISDLLVKKHKLSAKDAELFANAVFDIVNEGLKADKQVKIKGLGTFKIQAVKPRESINVNTGERVVIEGHEKVSFTPDAYMKELVNKPFSQFETVVLQDGVDFEDIDFKTTEEETAEEILTETSEKVEEKAEKVEEQAQNLTTKDIKVEETLAEEIVESNERFGAKTEEVDKTEIQKEAETSEKVVAVEPLISSNEAKQEVTDTKDGTVDTQEKIIEAKEEPTEVKEEVAETKEEIIEGEKEVVLQQIEEPTQPLVQPIMPTPTMEKATEEVVQKEEKPIAPIHIQPTPNEPTPDEEPAKIVEIETKSAETAVEEPAKVSPSVNTSSIEEPKKKQNWWWLLIAMFIILCVFGAYKFGKDCAIRDNKRDDLKVKVEQEAVKPHKKEGNTAIVQAEKPTQKPIKEKVEDATPSVENNEFKKLSNNPKIRYGAYDIIGVEKIVVLKKGETMESYSRKALGPDMVGYFQVLNGVNKMSAGDTMKVPKVELRPQYRSK